MIDRLIRRGARRVATAPLLSVTSRSGPARRATAEGPSDVEARKSDGDIVATMDLSPWVLAAARVVGVREAAISAQAEIRRLEAENEQLREDVAVLRAMVSMSA